MEKTYKLQLWLKGIERPVEFNISNEESDVLFEQMTNSDAKFITVNPLMDSSTSENYYAFNVTEISRISLLIN